LKSAVLLLLAAGLLVVGTLIAPGSGGGARAASAQQKQPVVKAERSTTRDAVEPAPQAPKPKPVVAPAKDGHVSQLAWRTDGKILATIALRYEVVDFTDGNGKRTGQGGVIPHSTIKLRDATTGKLKRSLGEEKDTYIAVIAFSADGKNVAVSTS